MNKREVGYEKEEIAEQFLKSKGLKILCKNYRIRIGEIDIIALDGDTYVFIEVKYRKTASKGLPEEAVNYKKMKTICKVSNHYRMKNSLPEITPVRYDVVAIEGDEIRWYPNAFDYCP